MEQEILAILNEVLSLKGRAAAMTRESPLLGAIPELDSMALVAVITTLEERFGFTVADDELDGASFATLGALADFVTTKFQSVG